MTIIAAYGSHDTGHRIIVYRKQGKRYSVYFVRVEWPSSPATRRRYHLKHLALAAFQVEVVNAIETMVTS